MAAPSARSQQNATDAETAAREAAATAAIEAQVAQAQAQAAQEQARVDQARAQVAQAEAQIQAAQQEMEAARAQLERAAREVAIQTRRASVTVDEDGLIRFNGGPGTPWVTYFGQGTRAQLGASLSDAEDGAQVTAITPGSGAADAGLQVGDVIRSIDGVDLATANELPAVEVINRLAAIEPGATVELVVARAGTELDIDVVTQEGQSSPLVFNTGSGQQVFLRTDRMPRLGQRFAESAEGAGGRGGQVVVTTDGSLESLRSLDTIRLFNWTGAPWGDMELVAITPELGRYFQTTEGLLVVRAPSDDAVGLQDGDVILTIGGRTPTSAEHAIRILGSFEPGEVIEFSLMRDGRRQPLEYTVEESDFRFISPTVIGVAPSAAPAAPAPGARGRGPAPAPSTPVPAEPVTPTSP
jgi:flagellar motor protein MotB